MAPDVFVQILRLHWTKRSRGGAGAQARASTPRAAALAGVRDPAGSLLIDELTFSEPDFQTVRATAVRPDLSDLPAGDGIRLTRYGNSLQVRFEYPPIAGAPTRWTVDAAGNRVPLAEDCFTLQPGRWGRVEWNGRTSATDTGEWSYQLTTVNIAFGIEVAADVFLATQPASTYSQLARLR